MTALVSTEWLQDHLHDKDVRIVDATWYLPTVKADAEEEFEGGHIPGAVYFDISDICDKSQAAPHMLPAPEQFAEQVEALGLDGDARIVVYDKGEYAAARVWWMFRVFGHEKVSVLDGGWPKWTSEGRAVETGKATVSPARFVARPRRDLVRSMQEMREGLAAGSFQIVDARPPERFQGKLPEIRPGVESGHIPGSVNVYYGTVIDPATGLYRSPDEIEGLFREQGIDVEKPVVATCGSGVSACQLALALYLTGRRDVPVYDGSWAEWGSVRENPKEL